MKRVFTLLILVLAAISAGSQTLQQGRNLFSQGNYVKAKPIMLKYLKQKPDDASRNYWYGVCCMETGEQEKAVPYLEKAAEKKIFKAFRALGRYYESKMDFAQAISNYESFVQGISKDKELHDQILEDSLTRVTDSLHVLLRAVRNTSKVCLTDSFVVSKDQLFSTIILSEQSGSLAMASDFFENNSLQGEVYLPETKQSILFTVMDNDSVFRMYNAYRSPDGWDDQTEVQGLEAEGNLRYPYLLNDGMTVYFAQDGPKSMGGLDIFVSRINPQTGRYFRPESLPMPFNSTANDYMLAIDESSGIGWFATDRRMNGDSVCIYTFLPETMDLRYNWEQDNHDLVLDAAQLKSIALTQTDENASAIRNVRQKLNLLRFASDQTGSESFTYIVDDLTVYHELSDFQSPEAKRIYQQWTETKDDFARKSLQLEDRRYEYSQADKTGKDGMSASMLEFEDQVLELERKVTQMENQIRTVELDYLKR